METPIPPTPLFGGKEGRRCESPFLWVQPQWRQHLREDVPCSCINPSEAPSPSSVPQDPPKQSPWGGAGKPRARAFPLRPRNPASTCSAGKPSAAEPEGEGEGSRTRRQPSSLLRNKSHPERVDSAHNKSRGRGGLEGGVERCPCFAWAQGKGENQIGNGASGFLRRCRSSQQPINPICHLPCSNTFALP